jgi:hypothetical protein
MRNWRGPSIGRSVLLYSPSVGRLSHNPSRSS